MMMNAASQGIQQANEGLLLLFLCRCLHRITLDIEGEDENQNKLDTFVM